MRTIMKYDKKKQYPNGVEKQKNQQMPIIFGSRSIIIQ